MKANTGSFYDKKSGNIGARRVSAGKKGIMAETFTLTAGATVNRDFEEIKMDGVDGVTSGFIYCKGPHDITINVNCQLPGAAAVTKPEIKVKVGEEFDLGQFNGRIYEMQITNTSGAATTDYTLVGE